MIPEILMPVLCFWNFDDVLCFWNFDENTQLPSTSQFDEFKDLVHFDQWTNGYQF